MEISLRLVGTGELVSLAAGNPHIEGVVLVPGALPPPALIALAATQVSSRMESLWYSFFLFVCEESKHAVGSGGFKGPPTAGVVEIGYHVTEPFRNRGVATSAVRQLLECASNSTQVNEVFAESSFANPASRRVLEKTGFRLTGSRLSGEDGEVHLWRYTRRPTS